MNTLRNAAMAAIYLAAAQAALAPPSFAADIVTDVAPPPPRVQHAPPPRDGYVWDGGHWAWSGTAYYWVDGGWVVQRRRLERIADQWEQVGDKWHFVPAHWQPAP
jgi:hypothetical protein